MCHGPQMRATQVMTITDYVTLLLPPMERGMEFSDLLVKDGIDPSEVFVLRHRPSEPKLRRALPWLAAGHPDLFNAYQRNQGPKVESAFKRARYIASFIGIRSGEAVFAGLYRVASWRELNFEEYWTIHENIALRDGYGLTGYLGDREVTLWFDLVLTEFYRQWQGRLTIRWPGLERSWKRWANRNEFLIESISDANTFEPDMPRWDELVLNWGELQILPEQWWANLSGWRGIYYIFDASDRKGYVGSAYGTDNLRQRWTQYVKTGHGGNKLLRGRDPGNFQFSILRLLNHDEDKDEVIRIETTWKKRLHTYAPDGLNDN